MHEDDAPDPADLDALLTQLREAHDASSNLRTSLEQQQAAVAQAQSDYDQAAQTAREAYQALLDALAQQFADEATFHQRRATPVRR